MIMPDLYVVLVEYSLAQGGTGYGVASGLWPDRDAAENALAHCKAKKAGLRGSEGRYCIARCTEEPDDA